MALVPIKSTSQEVGGGLCAQECWGGEVVSFRYFNHLKFKGGEVVTFRYFNHLKFGHWFNILGRWCAPLAQHYGEWQWRDIVCLLSVRIQWKKSAICCHFSLYSRGMNSHFLIHISEFKSKSKQDPKNAYLWHYRFCEEEKRIFVLLKPEQKDKHISSKTPGCATKPRIWQNSMAESACLQCMSWAFDWRKSFLQLFSYFKFTLLANDSDVWQMFFLCKTEKTPISGQTQIIWVCSSRCSTAPAVLLKGTFLCVNISSTLYLYFKNILLIFDQHFIFILLVFWKNFSY